MHTNYWLRTALREGEGGDGTSNGGGTTLLGGAAGGQQQQTQQQQFTPSFEGILGKDGAFTDGWTTKAFGPDYTGPLASAKTVGEVDKLLRDNMAAARGKLEWPGEKATPEQIAVIRKLTGAPEKADGYGDLRPETIPAELWDKTSEGKLQALAHKHHLPPAALKEIVGLYAESLDAAVKSNEASFATQRAAEGAKLKAEFGKDYDGSMHAAKRMALTLGMSIDDPVFNNAAVVIAMAKMAKLAGEDRLVNGATQGLAATPKAQANAIMTDKANPLYAKYQEGDKDTVSLVTNLLSQG